MTRMDEVLAREVVHYVLQYGSIPHHSSTIEQLRTCLRRPSKTRARLSGAKGAQWVTGGMRTRRFLD